MNSLAAKIQNAELAVMRVLWKAGGPVSLIDIRRELSARYGWEDSTIKTLLRRLCSKEIVKLERRGIYIAIVTEEEYNQWSIKNYVGKIFEGSAKNLVSALLSGGQLSDSDIDELSEMFNKEVENG